MKRLITLFVVAAAMAGTFAVFAPAASAHEAKTVNGYHWLVGWGSEPTYSGFENFVQFFLNSPNGQPVQSIGKKLHVTVETGSSKQSFPLVPSFDPDSGLGTKGEFDAFLIPTTPGTYTFHFTGNMGGPVDVSFTSGPETFSDVEDPSSVQFPTKVPTTLEVSQRLDQEVPRLQSQIADAQSHADSKANTAFIVAIIGIVVGLVGLGIAISANRRKKSSPSGG